MVHSRSHSRSMPVHLCATTCRCPHPRPNSPLRSPRYTTGPVELQFAGIWQPSNPPTGWSEFNQRHRGRRRRQQHCPPTSHHSCFPAPHAAETHLCGGGCNEARLPSGLCQRGVSAQSFYPAERAPLPPRQQRCPPACLCRHMPCKLATPHADRSQIFRCLPMLQILSHDGLQQGRGDREQLVSGEWVVCCQLLQRCL
jgi:hypothetical protein